MNDLTKISLTIQLEGSTLVRKSEPELISYQITKKQLNPKKKWPGKEGFKVVEKGEREHYSYTTKPAFQVIKINKTSYDYMVSSECPHWVKPKIWSKYTAKERLESHFQRICEDLKGLSFSYVILEN